MSWEYNTPGMYVNDVGRFTGEFDVALTVDVAYATGVVIYVDKDASGQIMVATYTDGADEKVVAVADIAAWAAGTLANQNYDPAATGDTYAIGYIMLDIDASKQGEYGSTLSPGIALIGDGTYWYLVGPDVGTA